MSSNTSAQSEPRGTGPSAAPGPAAVTPPAARPASAAPALTHPATPAQQLHGAIVTIAVASIKASDTNPRKTFEGIEELADSIKAQGLLENLVVRPLPKAGDYELIAGERRLRALKLAKIETALCKVLNVDDGTAMAAQIVENLQRQDIGPLEEAEAFAKLQAQDPKKWTPQAIAATVGKTDRFVQQRIAIATGLSAPLKKKFAEGEIGVEAARTLAPLPASVQNALPSWVIDRGDAADIRRQAFELCIPETAAKFDAALYTGTWIEGDKGRRYFGDTALFMKLQRAPAEKKLAEVRKDWPAAEIVSIDDAAKLHWADQQYSYSHSSAANDGRDGDVPRKFLVPKEKCTAIVWIAANGEIRKALGVCTAAAITAAANKRQTTTTTTRFKSPEGEKKDHKVARLAFNAAIAKAAANDATFTDRLFIFNVVTDTFEVMMSRNAVDKLLPPAVAKARPAGYNRTSADSANLWREIARMPAGAVTRAIHGILLGECPTWDDHDHKEKPDLKVAIAQSLGVTPPAIALPQPKVKAAQAVVDKAVAKIKATAKAKAVKKKKGARK